MIKELGLSGEQYDLLATEVIKEELLSFALASTQFKPPASEEDIENLKNRILENAKENPEIFTALQKISNMELSDIWAKKLMRTPGLKEFLKTYKKKKLEAVIQGTKGPLTIVFDEGTNELIIKRDFPSSCNFLYEGLCDIGDETSLCYKYEGKVYIPYMMNVCKGQVQVSFLPLF